MSDDENNPRVVLFEKYNQIESPKNWMYIIWIRAMWFEFYTFRGIKPNSTGSYPDWGTKHEEFDAWLEEHVETHDCSFLCRKCGQFAGREQVCEECKDAGLQPDVGKTGRGSN